MSNNTKVAYGAMDQGWGTDPKCNQIEYWTAEKQSGDSEWAITWTKCNYVQYSSELPRKVDAPKNATNTNTYTV